MLAQCNKRMFRTWIYIKFCTLFLLFYSSILDAQNCNFTITVPSDITLCEPSQVLLDGAIFGDYFSHEWNGSNGYLNTTNLTPTTFVSETTTFTLEVVSLPLVNIIFNGDFEFGNTGFTSDYALSTPGYTCPSGNQVWGSLGCEGVYIIGTNPSLTHAAFPPCMDHTNGGSNMMMVNGAPSLQQVWCQTINVNPGTDYIIQAFATSISPSSPAILQFSIGGSLLGNALNLTSATCNWQEFFTEWNSGSNTSVEICITNQNTSTGGNDFAIDDIFFGPLCKEEMAFTVTISDFTIEPVSFDVLSCNNTSTRLSVSPFPIFEYYDFMWQTVGGTIESDPYQQTIDISSPGIYAVTVTNADGCEQNIAYLVSGNLNLPILTITGDTTIDCNSDTTILRVTSNEPISNFIWTLPNGTTTIGNQITTTLPGIYQVSGTNSNLCIGEESTIVIYENLLFEYDTDTILPIKCNTPTIDITLLNMTPFDSIMWRGPGIKDIKADQTAIKVDRAGYYYFTFFLGDRCTHTDSVSVEIIPDNIQYELNNPDTLSCNKSEVTLSLSTTSSSDKIKWFYNNVELTSIDTLLVSEAGIYNFEIEDINGCKVNDTILVPADYEIPIYQAIVDSIDCVDNIGGFISTSTNAVSFYWEGNNQVSEEKNPIFDQEGIYSLIISGKNGCKDTLAYFLPSSKSFPELFEIIDAITCTNPIGRIEISTSINASIRWVNELGNTGTNNIISSPDAGLYTIIATAENGCENEKTIRLPIDTLSPLLAISLTDTLTCDVTQVMPMVIATNYDNFSWQGPSYNNQAELTPLLTKPGKYLLTLVGENGCIKSEEIIVSENKAKPNFSLLYEDLTCYKPKTFLTINDNSGMTQSYYLISGNNKVEISTGYEIGSAGQFTLEAVNHLGCDSIITFQIDAFLDLPQSQFDPDTINCKAREALLFNKIEGSQQLTYVWQTNQDTELTDTITVNSAQQIVVTTINQYGCKTENTVEIYADFKLPDIQINGSGIIGCNDTSTLLQAIFSNQSYQIFWNGPDSINVNGRDLTVNDIGRYTLYAEDTSNGCTTFLQKEVTKQKGPTSYDLIIDQPLCYGDVGSFKLSNISGGTSPFSLVINNVPYILNTAISVVPGSFEWIVTDVNGCTIREQFIISTALPLTLDAGRDTTIRLFDSYPIQIYSNLTDGEIADITWTPYNTLSCENCLDPIATPLSDTRYMVTLIDKKGCEISDDITIRVKFVKGYIAPNVFNPQSSSGNNHFTIYSKDKSIEKINIFNVYDRWGNLVFTQKDFPADQPSLGWDGNFGGNAIQNGVYVWLAEILYRDQTLEVVKGDVTIIR